MIAIFMHGEARLVAEKEEDSDQWKVTVEGVEDDLGTWLVQVTRQILTAIYLMASLALLERGLLGK